MVCATKIFRVKFSDRFTCTLYKVCSSAAAVAVAFGSHFQNDKHDRSRPDKFSPIFRLNGNTCNFNSFCPPPHCAHREQTNEAVQCNFFGLKIVFFVRYTWLAFNIGKLNLLTTCRFSKRHMTWLKLNISPCRNKRTWYGTAVRWILHRLTTQQHVPLSTCLIDLNYVNHIIDWGRIAWW